MANIPEFVRPEQMDRVIWREQHANFMINCECGQVQYSNKTDINGAVEEWTYWHPHHKKYVHYRSGGEREYRGTIPNMQNEDEHGRG